jgi:hypothetical protein
VYPGTKTLLWQTAAMIAVMVSLSVARRLWLPDVPDWLPIFLGGAVGGFVIVWYQGRQSYDSNAPPTRKLRNRYRRAVGPPFCGPSHVGCLSRACSVALVDEGVEKGGAVGLVVLAGAVALADEDGHELGTGAEVGAGLAG